MVCVRVLYLESYAGLPPEDDLNEIETCWNVFKCFNMNDLD